MRHWLFHPLIFYPLVALLAVLVIGVSIRPQAWPRSPAPVAGKVENGVLVLERDAFNSPEKSPEQNLTVARDLVGNAQTLHVAVLPGNPPPTPAETGVRILLTPESAALLDGKAVTVDVTYRPQPVNTVQQFAVALLGIGPADWVTATVQPQAGVLRYNLPEGIGVNAIGLRAVSTASDQAYGLEIVRIAAYPTPARPTPPPAPVQDTQPAPGN